MINPDEFRLRYLRERVLTASPAQRVAMLYDRLALDLARASDPVALPVTEINAALDHALQIIAELRSSLDHTAGGPADNLAGLYGYLITEILAVRCGQQARLAGAVVIVTTLRDAWTMVADEVASGSTVPRGAGEWVS